MSVWYSQAVVLHRLAIGQDGLCRVLEGEEFRLRIDDVPIPFSFRMECGEGAASYLTFLLTRGGVGSVHVHGGGALIGPELLSGCIERCRTLYDGYAARVAGVN